MEVIRIAAPSSDLPETGGSCPGHAIHEKETQYCYTASHNPGSNVTPGSEETPPADVTGCIMYVHVCMPISKSYLFIIGFIAVSFPVPVKLKKMTS